jgi:hypothetical protein
MLAHDVCRESNMFSPPRRHARHIGPHDKMDTYASKRQRHLQSYGQEQPSITPITVSDHNRGPQLYVAPKDNEVHLLAHLLHCTPLTRFRTLVDNLRFICLIIVQL